MMKMIDDGDDDDDDDDDDDYEGAGSVAKWLGCRPRNPEVPGSSPALCTSWSCSL